jgi:hypothetical protein
MWSAASHGRTPRDNRSKEFPMRTRWFVPALVLLVIQPAAVEAQRKRVPARDVYEGSYANRFSLEPYAGAYNDDYQLDDAKAGYLVGLKLGYAWSGRGRLLGNVGYSRTDDVGLGGGATGATLDNTWVLTTGGAEYDVIPGRTSAAIAVEAGAAWRKVDVAGGPIALPDNATSDSFTAITAIVPGLSVRHRFTSRAAVGLSLQDYMLDLFDGPTQHNLALTLGVTFR